MLTMAKDEQTGNDDNMLAPTMKEGPAARASPGRDPPSVVPRQPAGPLDGLHVFRIFMAVVRWPPMGSTGHDSDGDAAVAADGRALLLGVINRAVASS
jgi:hypothetical protein